MGVSVADPQIAHTHLDCALPRYGEITGPIPVTCIIKLFHTAGVASGVYSPLDQIRDIIYEDTGTSTPPVLRGDPMGLKQWKVSFIFDPTLLRRISPPSTTVPPRGWFSVDIAVKTYYDNGDTVTLDAVRTLYSMLNPNVPEIKGSDEGITYATRCSPNTLRRPELNAYGNQMGTVVSEFVGLLPLEPIQEPWQTKGFFYSNASLEGIPGPQPSRALPISGWHLRPAPRPGHPQRHPRCCPRFADLSGREQLCEHARGLRPRDDRVRHP